MKRAAKRFWKVLTSRSLLFAVLAALQILAFFTLLWQFSRIGPYTYALMIIVSVLVLVFVFEKDDLNPSYKVMWVLLTVLLPITGAVMYLLGTEMDFKTDKLASQFVFNNPNQKSACGCGESVEIEPVLRQPCSRSRALSAP